MRRSTAAELAAHAAAEEQAMAAHQAALDAARALDERHQAEAPPTAPEVLAARMKAVRGEALTLEEQHLLEEDALRAADVLASRTEEEREIYRRADAAAAAIRRMQRYQRN